MGKIKNKPISIKQLKIQFPDVRDLKPYGWCVVVPGAQFDPDWEYQFEDQGYKVHMVELDRRPVALVSCVKKEPVEETEREVYAPPPPDPESRKHLMPMAPTAPVPIQGRGSYLKAGNKLVSWTQPDLDRLLEEWPRARGGVDEKAEALTRLFPGRMATAIKLRYLKLLKTPKTSLKQESQKPETTKHGRGFYWSEQETDKLVSLWNQDLRLSDIAKALPSRSYKSIRSAVDRLQLAGKIEKRKSGGQRRRKMVDVCQDCGLPKDLCCCDEEKKEQQRATTKEVQNSYKVAKVDNVDKVTESQTSPTTPSEMKKLTDVIENLVTVVDKLGCQAIMQALEIKEMKQADFKIPLGTWTAYASALISPDKERRDQFREKVRKVLEAYE